MLVTVACPSCGVNLQTSPERLGQRKKCPQCHELVVLPAPSAHDETAVEIPIPKPEEIQRGAGESS